jgi:hypothetical protein
MSPELYSGVEYGVKTDIWALGCAAFEVSMMVVVILWFAFGHIYKASSFE